MGRCQCSPECRQEAVKGTAFCKLHQSNCPRIAPLSGDELAYDPKQWNRYKGIKEAHNCFAYAYGFMDMPNTPNCTKESCPISFPQPGQATGHPGFPKVDGKRCPDIIGRALSDVPNSHRAAFTQRCAKGMRKVAFVVDPKEDYHVYRQDRSGKWSHKPGGTDVTDLDASKNPIYDPKLADRSYKDSKLNYNKFCGYICIPTKKHRLRRSGGKRKTRKYRKR